MNEGVATNLEICEWLARMFVVRGDARNVNRGYWRGVEYQEGKRLPLDHETLGDHVLGNLALSAFFIKPRKLGKLVAIDLDNKTGCRNVSERHGRYAIAIVQTLEEKWGIHSITEYAGRDGGIHIWVPFDRLLDSSLLFEFGHRLTEQVLPYERFGIKEPEVFPKERDLGKEDGLGSSLRLPGRHPETRRWSSFDFEGRHIRWGGDMSEMINWQGNSADRFFAKDCHVPYKSKQEIWKEQEAQARSERQRSEGGCFGSVADIFARHRTWKQVLEPHDWEVASQAGSETRWRKPNGSRLKSHAATNSEKGDVLYVFSEDAPPFVAGDFYTKWRAYCLLDHNDDSEAAEAAYLNC